MTETPEIPSSTSAPPIELPPLDRRQRRILGVLIEKAFCTPEQYPLTVNALVSGCNQKSNRDPVTNFAADQIDEALIDLQAKSLVIRIQPVSGRTDRWKHSIKEAWSLDRPDRAVLAELLLRGGQSEGEMRARASRMVDIPSLDDLRTILERLRSRGFVERLSPEGRMRGVAWTHKAFSPAEIEEQRQRLASGDETSDSASEGESARDSTRSSPSRIVAVADPMLLERFEKLEAELATVKAELATVRQTLDGLLH